MLSGREAPSAEFEVVRACPLCSGAGRPRYGAVEDRLFGVPGTASMMECPRCGLLWLTPRLTRAGIAAAYREYYTHQPPMPARVLGRWRETVRSLVLRDAFGAPEGARTFWWASAAAVLSRVPPVAERVEPLILELGHRGPLKLLDVGSGDGLFLATMRRVGWDVCGIEPDPLAARRSREEQGVPVHEGSLEQVDPGAAAFDVVVARHVLEHVHDPVSFLEACARAARVGGRVIVLTPNAGSLGHRVFGRDWLHLDPPRHLHVFSRESLRKCCAAAGLSRARIRTLARHARPTWQASRLLRRHRRLPLGRVPLRVALEGVCFALVETLLCWRPADAGEELMMTAIKG